MSPVLLTEIPVCTTALLGALAYLIKLILDLRVDVAVIKTQMTDDGKQIVNLGTTVTDHSKQLGGLWAIADRRLKPRNYQQG